MKHLSLDDLLGVNDVEVRKIELPELGGFVYVRSMTVYHLEKMDSLGPDESKAAYMIAHSLCDEQGRFLNPSPAQVAAIANKSPRTVGKIVEVISELNEFTRESVEEVEEALKKTHADSS